MICKKCDFCSGVREFTSVGPALAVQPPRRTAVCYRKRMGYEYDAEVIGLYDAETPCPIDGDRAGRLNNQLESAPSVLKRLLEAEHMERKFVEYLIQTCQLSVNACADMKCHYWDTNYDLDIQRKEFCELCAKRKLASIMQVYDLRGHEIEDSTAHHS